jgi:hypothetical protein
MITKHVLISEILENFPSEHRQEAITALTSGSYTLTLTQVQNGELQGLVNYRTGDESSVSFTGSETETKTIYTLTCPSCVEVCYGDICQHAGALALCVLHLQLATQASPVQALAA